MASPWNSVLNTNYAPTDDEAIQIRAFCEKPQQKVWEIDREIQQLRERLNDLLHERGALVEMLEHHKALVSPVRRLSPEMLQQIFFCCLPVDRNPAVHPSEAPLLLGRICRLWREIANSTPRLWSAIHIVIPSKENASLASARYDALRTWLGRSGATPLHISLRAHLPTEDILPFPFADYIVGFSTRWSSVTLALPMAVILRLCSNVNGSVPILDTVRFDCVDMSPPRFIPNIDGLSEPDTTNDTYVISQFVLRNPSIRHYSLTQQSRQEGHWQLICQCDPIAQLFLCQESPSSLKLETLTLSLPLDIMFTGLQPILDLLSALPHLKRCSLRCCVERGASEIPLRPTPVALHALEELSLGITMRNSWGDESYLLPNLFANLLLPRITNMRILSGITSDPTRAFTSFTQLLIRSSASLQRLSVQIPDESDVFLTLIPVLEASPELRELTVRELNRWGNLPSQGQNLGLGNQVLQVLSTLSASTSLLCPQLDKLSLFVLSDSYPTDPFLTSFFMVRRLSPAQCNLLASFCVRCIDSLGHWSDELMAPIEYKLTNEVESMVNELKQNGMTIEMSKPIMKWINPSGPYLGLETPDD